MLKRCVLQICEALSIKRNPSPLLLCNFVNLSIVVIYLNIRASEHLIWAFDIRANRLKIKLKILFNDSSLVYVTLSLLLYSLKRVCVFINNTKHGRRSLSIKNLFSILRSRDVQIFVFLWNHRFQNMWPHHRHCYIMEVRFRLISFET